MHNIFHKISKRTTVPAWQRAIVLHIQSHASIIGATLVWLLALHFLPFFWESTGEMPLFLSQLLIKTMTIAIQLVIGSSIVWIAYNLADDLVEFLIRHIPQSENNLTLHSHFVPFVTKFIKIIIVCGGSIFVLQNIGINVASLLAGLGLGGLALALAAKRSASDALAYISIMLDQPFLVGDWISFGDTEGTVVEIGIRSCKLKTFYDSIVVIPNSVLIENNIDNIGKRKARRTRTHIGIQYDTDPELITEFVEGVKQILKNNQYIKSDYFQVYFTEIGASELKIFINFFLMVPDWETELQQKQSIFIKILQLAKKLQVEFAFPTQTIHVDSLPQQKMDSIQWYENTKIPKHKTSLNKKRHIFE